MFPGVGIRLIQRSDRCPNILEFADNRCLQALDSRDESDDQQCGNDYQFCRDDEAMFIIKQVFEESHCCVPDVNMVRDVVELPADVPVTQAGRQAGKVQFACGFGGGMATR